MKISEIGNKAEALIENGEIANNKQRYYSQAVARAMGRVRIAQEGLMRASELDDEGNYRGNPERAQAELMAASLELQSARKGLEQSNYELANVNKEKNEAIAEVDKYVKVEEKNLSAITKLQKLAYGGNSAKFITDLADRMNYGQKEKEKLLKSMGQEYDAKTYAPGGIGGQESIGMFKHTAKAASAGLSANIGAAKTVFNQKRRSILQYAKEYIAKMVDTCKKAIVQYSGEVRPNGQATYYGNINAHLRTNESLEKGNDRVLNNLDEALNDARLPESVVAYRAFNLNDICGLSGLTDKELVGKVVYDKGFMSVSNVSDASEMSSGISQGRDTFMEIYIPKGSRGLDIEELSVCGDSESEILMGRNQLMKVDSVRYESVNGEKKRIIRMLLL